MQLTRNTRRAVKVYGETACRCAYRMHQTGEGARTIGLTGPRELTTTRQADAAIEAGRELARLDRKAA